MPGNSFGQSFRITTAGESHGPGNVVIIDGVPPGIPVTVDDLMVDLNRRRPGQSSIVTQRDEPDEPEILSGVFDGRTTGTSLAILIRNKDQRSKDYSDIKDLYRPGHADFSFDAKYGFRDYRGGGRSSARETNVRVAAGSIAKKLLAEKCGTRIVGYVTQVGEIKASIADPAAITLGAVESRPDGTPNIVRCPDIAAADKMIALIEECRKDGDSIGGAAEIVATEVPAGLGEPVFDKVKADLAKALFSLPAVLGVEYGIGFGCVTMRAVSTMTFSFRNPPRTRSLRSSRRPIATAECWEASRPGCQLCSGRPSSRRAACRSNNARSRDMASRHPSARRADTTLACSRGSSRWARRWSPSCSPTTT